MGQEKSWFLNVINLKYFFLNIFFIFNIVISASPVEELNSFFKNDLSFTQTSFNKINRDYDKSEGTFKRNSDNSIKIDILSPFKEIYFINEGGVEIHDLEFNQIKNIPLDQFNNFFVNFIFNNSIDNTKISSIKNKSFTLIEDDKNFYFEFIDENTLQIKFKDNMEISNIIKFFKSNK